MDIHRLIRLGRPVPSILLDPRCVEKVSRSDRLLNRDDITWVWIGLDHDFDSFAKSRELVAHISYPAQRFELQEVFVAPPEQNFTLV
jgi:hypothetical protein